MFHSFHISQRAAWIGSILTLFILATALVAYSLRTVQEEALPVVSEPIAPVAPVIATVTPEPAPQPEPEPEPAPVISQVAPVEPVAPVAPTVAHVPASPLQGEVVSAFSVAELVYSPTMDDWRIHDGMDIAAQIGTPVMATFAGVVSSVTDDDFMGTTVVIDHGDGYQTTYANLQTTPTVAEGDVVKTGAILGAVGTTATAEAALEPHLHFGVSLDGDAIDPSDYLAR